MTTFTWRPIGMKADQDLDGLVDAVVWVQWQCNGLEFVGEQPYSAGVEGELTLAPDPSQPFIPMYQLTDEIVMNWVFDNGVNKLEVESQVQALIDAQKVV
jgi:hypothetical protein